MNQRRKVVFAPYVISALVLRMSAMGLKLGINDIAKSSRETKTISSQHQPVLVELLCIIA